MNQSNNAKGRKKDSQTAKTIKTKSKNELPDQNNSNSSMVHEDYFPTP